MNLEQEFNKEISRRDFVRGVFLASLAAALLNSKMAYAAEQTADTIGSIDLCPLNDAHFLMYHEVSASRLKADTLSYLQRGYQPISLETLGNHFNGISKIPADLPIFMITCDDGLASQYPAILQAVDSIREETGWFVPVTCFTMTKFDDPSTSIENIPGDISSYNDGKHSYMTKDQLVHLIKIGHYVENHTVNHGFLGKLLIGARNSEVIEGEQRINILWRMARQNKDDIIFLLF